MRSLLCGQCETTEARLASCPNRVNASLGVTVTVEWSDRRSRSMVAITVILFKS